MEDVKQQVQRVKAFKKKVNAFEALQQEKLGFRRYKVCGSKDDFVVEAYTSSGKYIKASVTCASEQKILEFIDERIKGMERDL